MLPAQALVDNPVSGTSAIAPPVSGGAILRALLNTNGSITSLLESFFGEKITVVKLSEEELIFPCDQPLLNSKTGDPGIERTTLLRGSTSQQTYLHARSTIALKNICPDFRNSLLTTNDPIGKLWARHRMETFKTILNFDKRLADDLAVHFAIEDDAPLISRTYQVFSNQKCAMLIEETFAEDLGRYSLTPNFLNE